MLSEISQQFLDISINMRKLDKKGYHIPEKLELFDKELIFNELGSTGQLLDHLEILNSVDSTNTYLLKKAADLKRYAVFAEQQTNGRGQHNRHWISEFGKGIALSILSYFPHDTNHRLSGLSLAMGLTVAQTLEEYGLNEIQLKWPNDVVHREKKLAGILIETKISKPKLSTIVVGIGLNLYRPNNGSRTIDQAITDVHTILALPLQRNRLAGLLLKKILIALFKFQAEGFFPFLEAWQRMDSLNNQYIDIRTSKSSVIEGVAKGVNVLGQLCVEINGETHCFYSGEIRIRKKFDLKAPPTYNQQLQ